MFIGFKRNLFKNMDFNELDLAMQFCDKNSRFYTRLKAMNFLISFGNPKVVAFILKVSFSSIYRWAKACEEGGLEALKLSFGGGRPCKLSDDELIKLDKMILEQPNMSMKDVQHLVKEEFDVEYSLKQIGVITRDKLGYNYSKAYPLFEKSPENRDEILEKRLKENKVTEKDIIMFFDESSYLNAPYTRKRLYKKGTKNIQVINPERIKVNVSGALAVNGKSGMMITNSSTIPEISRVFVHMRMINTKDSVNKHILKEIIKLSDIPEEEIDKKVMEKKEDKTEFATKIEKAIDKYGEDTISMLRIIRKRCNGESRKNNEDKKKIKNEILKEMLEKYNIEEEMQKERRIVMILDNFSTHRSKEIKEIAKILNITLIYLPPYSPQLNPIEQLWRKMKGIMKKYYIESREDMERKIIKTFYESIEENNMTEKWMEKFIKN